MADLAREKGGRVMIGLQAVQAPVVKRIRKIIEEGKIGRVISTTFAGGAGAGGKSESEGMLFMLDRDSGGGIFNIHFMHAFQGILSALGEGGSKGLETFNSILDIGRRVVEVVDSEVKVVKTVERTTPDQILVQGRLDKSGALVSVHLIGLKAFEKGDGLYWRIYGTEGEIAVTGSGTTIGIGMPDLKIRVSDNEGNVEDVEVEGDELSKNLSFPAQGVGRLYEAFANGEREKYLDWDAAVERHRLIDEMYRRADEGKQGVESSYSRI